MDNYNLIIMNLEEMIKENKGINLLKFLDDDHHGTTLRIVIDDERLDPNQFTTGMDYFKYDHDDLQGMGQVVNRFKSIIKEKSENDEDAPESFKIQYAYIDFNAMMFQRKQNLIYEQEVSTMSTDTKMPYLSKGELIHLISDIIEQTDNDLDK